MVNVQSALFPFQEGSTHAGTTKIDPCRRSKPNSDSKITFLNRQDGSVNFTRNWQDYKTGFGDLSGEFWLGLDCLHGLTKSNVYSLVVDFTDFKGRSYQAQYSKFSVGPESELYRLRVGGYNQSSVSSGGDGFTMNHVTNNNMRFSTPDRDNDICGCHCASSWKGGWWYSNCGMSNPTGRGVPMALDVIPAM